MSDRMAYRTAPASERSSQLASHAIENPVDEATRLLRAKLLGDLDGFVDGYLGGALGVPQQLVDGRSENVPIHRGHALEVPVLDRLGDERVDLALIQFGPVHQLFREGPGLRIDGVSRPELRRR